MCSARGGGAAPSAMSSLSTGGAPRRLQHPAVAEHGRSAAAAEAGRVRRRTAEATAAAARAAVAAAAAFALQVAAAEEVEAARGGARSAYGRFAGATRRPRRQTRGRPSAAAQRAESVRELRGGGLVRAARPSCRRASARGSPQ